MHTPENSSRTVRTLRSVRTLAPCYRAGTWPDASHPYPSRSPRPADGLAAMSPSMAPGWCRGSSRRRAIILYRAPGKPPQASAAGAGGSDERHRRIDRRCICWRRYPTTGCCHTTVLGRQRTVGRGDGAHDARYRLLARESPVPDQRTRPGERLSRERRCCWVSLTTSCSSWSRSTPQRWWP